MASRNFVQGSSVSHTMSITAWLELVASGLITGGIYALVALGLNLQYGLMRILNIAHGEFLMLGAYLTWMAQTSFGLSPLWMVPVSFGLLMALGLAVHGLCFRRLTATSPNLDIFEARGLMVSFGLMFLVQNFVLDGLGRRAARLRLPDRSGEVG
jgi:branched-chain amino acid transport system permease protein